MKILTTMPRVRRHIRKYSKTYMLTFLGVLMGLLITFDTLDALANLFGIFSLQNEHRLCLFLSLALAATIPLALLLKSDLDLHKKYLKIYAPPDFNIYDQEEYDEAWNNAVD